MTFQPSNKPRLHEANLRSIASKVADTRRVNSASSIDAYIEKTQNEICTIKFWVTVQHAT